MSVRSFLKGLKIKAINLEKRLKIKQINLGLIQFEVINQPKSGSSLDPPSLNKPALSEELINSMDSDDLRFQELELTVSEVWEQFIDLVKLEHANFKIEKIIEDEDTESTFGCSGAPGTLTWSIQIVGIKEGVKTTLTYDLIDSWLLPLAKSIGPSDGSIPWDNSLFEAPGKIGDKKTYLRNANYWMMFVNKKTI